MNLRALPLILLLLAACRADETISGYADPQTLWALQELDGQPFTARATLQFPSEGKVAGRAPCNSFGAVQSVPLPWIEITAIRATRSICPEIEAEQRYLAALQAMTLAEVAGDVLILHNNAGREMVFRAD
ncbi:META domain-containing protein [Jannaschia pohangensis]|uniref:META domain-containing protein n=1 Tax=Jannaschia pohangensis TaxID=390807 RepID=A0A1I3LGL0_9RHOB|nr:META domain-containing protein [Jannaschia pohangensis]SFI83902.1 META domain-containing protein [Jannaschia pohangensis]